ncbi:MAG: endopeptidase La [Clostridia bacterium]|nr:endopeptidase La [Clostridia bacterium]
MTEKNLYNIPCVALRGMTIFPNVLFHFDVGRAKSIKAIETALEKSQEVFLVTQKDITEDDPSQDGLYSIGTLCKVCQTLRVPGDTVRVLVEGLSRAYLNFADSSDDFIKADITVIEDIPAKIVSQRDIALMRRVKEQFYEFAPDGQVPNEILVNISDNEDISFVSDYIAHYSPIKYEYKQQLLSESSPRRRLSMLDSFLNEEHKIRAVEEEISGKVRSNMDKNERDYYLREQIKVLSEELGEGEDPKSESSEYITKIKELHLSGDSEAKLIKEAKRLSKMPPSSPESAVITSYLDEVLDLPWNSFKEVNYDISKASEILDRDHYGLEKVKERILESFAVLKRTGNIKGQIICLVGPPGVGKTSVASSIARACGRDFARLSLGGVRDEADIRGHRKTYIGSMPGRIMTALKHAGSKNCLILIDEVDKLGNDYKGDPSSALLEVFDAEQNNAFVDHYIEIPFDLSNVLFITTANDRDSIPTPLLDRMEIIELSGYTDEEKVHISKEHLIPKFVEKNGLCDTDISIPDDVIRVIIRDYTRESGVRALERTIDKLCRKCAKELEESKTDRVTFTEENLEKYLGIKKYKDPTRGKTAECGVVCGLAWTSVGGEILEAEVSAVEGSGKLELTGNLGDVMKESSKAALTYIRSRREKLMLPPEFFSKHDIHVHFPEGAVPKDGPSAGITVATAMISAFTDLPVSKNIAMTGEITLRGRVLPIGGLKEKSMAAFREGIKNVIIPADNVKDIEEIDKTVKENIKFIPVSQMDEVVSFVFGESLKEKLSKNEDAITVAAIPHEETAVKRIRQ